MLANLTRSDDSDSFFVRGFAATNVDISMHCTANQRGWRQSWGISSIGRASGWQPEGQGFKSPILHSCPAIFSTRPHAEPHLADSGHNSLTVGQKRQGERFVVRAFGLQAAEADGTKSCSTSRRMTHG